MSALLSGVAAYNWKYQKIHLARGRYMSACGRGLVSCVTAKSARLIDCKHCLRILDRRRAKERR
jgi:hypothetical protein